MLNTKSLAVLSLLLITISASASQEPNYPAHGRSASDDKGPAGVSTTFRPTMKTQLFS